MKFNHSGISAEFHVAIRLSVSVDYYSFGAYGTSQKH
jgi:hypothetical protein